MGAMGTREVGTSSLELDELLQSSSTVVSSDVVEKLAASYHRKSLVVFTKEYLTWGPLSVRAPVLYAVDKFTQELKSLSMLWWVGLGGGWMTGDEVCAQFMLN